jgi:hypothetical protein
MNNRNFVIVMAILAMVVLVSLSAYSPARFNDEPEAKMADFPKLIGEWGGQTCR